MVAYRQPVSRASVEAVRGVACGELLRQLMERDLIRIAGRSEELGRPYLYGTTKRFLQLFGLPSTDALPPIQWQTLREDPPPPESLPESSPEDLSTPMKEAVVSTAVASLVADTESDASTAAATDVVASDLDSISAVIEDEENEVYDEDDEEEFEDEDDEYDDEYDDGDEDWDEEDEDDEDGDEDWRRRLVTI